jgi:beta-lactamase regulating signal transducer with metallopeptidase domain
VFDVPVLVKTQPTLTSPLPVSALFSQDEDFATSPVRDNRLQTWWINIRDQINGLQLFLTFWLLGSSLFALRFMLLWRNFNLAVGQRQALDHQATIDCCRRLQSQMAIKRQLKLTQSAQISSPMVDWLV